MYTSVNFKTKAAFKKAVAHYLEDKAKGIDGAQPVTLWAPGLGTPKRDGEEIVEGPLYPAPHKWYATAVMENGIVVKVK